LRRFIELLEHCRDTSWKRMSLFCCILFSGLYTLLLAGYGRLFIFEL
jgi:nucleoside recognition membrane protein YjiH